jgi:ribonuclease-3
MSEKVLRSAAGQKNANVSALASALGHKFVNNDLLQQALTHSSHANESPIGPGASVELGTRVNHNEQLEFLGDSVLAFVTSQAIFQRYPQYSEGQLSKIRAHLVSARHLLEVAKELELGTFLRLGKGEEHSGGRQKSALLVNTLEALLAALYLDGGLEPARTFILARIIYPELERMEKDPENALALSDQKSALQEWLQSVGGPSPVYQVVREDGPDHDKTFTVELRIGSEGGSDSEAMEPYISRARGTTKKKAEQNAAQEALKVLRSRGRSIQP